MKMKPKDYLTIENFKEKMNCITYGLLVQPGGGFRLKYQTS